MHRYLGENGANFLGEIFGARGSGGTAIPVRNERLAQGGFQFFSAINVNFFQHGHNSDTFGWTTAEAFMIFGGQHFAQRTMNINDDTKLRFKIIF